MIASHVLALKRPARHHLALATAATGLAAVIAVAAVSMADPAHAAGPPDIGLGRAAQFSVLADEGVTNTGATTVIGLVGSGPTQRTVTGGNTITPPDNVRVGPDGDVDGGKADLLVAYGQASGAQVGSTTLTAPDIGGPTLVGGTYTKSGSLGFTGTLTLDGENDPNSVFIFQVAANFTVENSAEVLLTRGAQACHVYWQIGNDTTIGTGVKFKGNILAGNDISANTGSTFQGRLLSNDGAITLNNNTFTNPACAAATTPTSSAPAAPAPTATKKPTPKPTKSKGSAKSKGDRDKDSSGEGSSDGSGGSGDSGSGSNAGGADGAAGSDADGTTSTSTGIPNAGGPPMFLAPVGAGVLLVGAGLVVASRRRRPGAHRA